MLCLAQGWGFAAGTWNGSVLVVRGLVVTRWIFFLRGSVARWNPGPVLQSGCEMGVLLDAWNPLWLLS